VSGDPGSPPALTRKQATWLACKAKTCCYTAFVVPSGRDVWRISRALDAPPWTYLVYFSAPRPRRDAFRLDQSGRRYCLLFAKQASRRTKTPKPCIFLMRSRDGVHRCGLGDLRPLGCKVFPAELVDGVVCVQSTTGCTCRPWALTDMEIAEELPLLDARQREAEEYFAVVADWNARVATAPAGASFTFVDYCRHVLTSYDGLAALTADASPAAAP
jgi:hypothetical protein